MKHAHQSVSWVAAVAVVALASGSALAGPLPSSGGRSAGATLGPAAAQRAPAQARDRRRSAESERLSRAKDLMADQQWSAAIAVLRDAVGNPAEPGKDEALFWLAHCQKEAGDLGDSVKSVTRLQREYPASRWTRPAFSLLIDLAQRLGREDVLWRTAAPPPPPPSPAAPPAPPSSRSVPAPPPPPPPPGAWLPDTYRPDMDLQIQALGWLMQTAADKAIPLLRSIALDTEHPGAARRALFILAQSRHPEAETTVVDVATRGTEPVRLAAVRELGRFGGADVSRQLLQVYPTGNASVKEQIVASLALRAEAPALLQIARSEPDTALRRSAIIALGRARGHEHLRALYDTVRRDLRHAVIIGLFNARDEDGLIAVADREEDPALRDEVLARLRLMGTPRAAAYVDKVK